MYCSAGCVDSYSDKHLAGRCRHPLLSRYPGSEYSVWYSPGIWLGCVGARNSCNRCAHLRCWWKKRTESLTRVAVFLRWVLSIGVGFPRLLIVSSIFFHDGVRTGFVSLEMLIWFLGSVKVWSLIIFLHLPRWVRIVGVSTVRWWQVLSCWFLIRFSLIS